MPISTVEDLDQLMVRYEEIVFDRKPSLDALITDPDEFADALLNYVDTWQTLVKQLEQLIPQITGQEYIEREFSTLIAEISTEFESLLVAYEYVKKLLGPVTLEDAHSELISGMRHTINNVETILHQFVPKYPPYKMPETMLSLIT